MQKTRKKRNTVQPVSAKSTEKKGTETYKSPFNLRNYLVFGLGLIILAIGFYFLAQPANAPGKLPAEGFLSLNVAPLLLVTAYLVIIPIALLIRKKSKTEEDSKEA